MKMVLLLLTEFDFGKAGLKSTLDVLLHSKQHFVDNVTFVLNSFLFLIDHKTSCAAIKQFADAGFLSMNPMIEALMLRQQQ